MPLPSWTPELPTLDLLLSVAELGSVGKAAALHGISQPSASERLMRLERRLDVALLVRTARGSSLTPAGEVVVAWARDVVASAHRFDDGIRTLREQGRTRLRVSASLTIAEYLLPHWLLVLRRRHPDLDISAHVANSAEVCDRLRGGDADLGFVETPVVPKDLSRRKVGTDRLALIVAASYPLAAKANALRATDLPDQPLLLREPGSGTRDTFLHAMSVALHVRDPKLPHAIHLGSTTTIVATVRAGGGIGVVSARAVEDDVRAGTLVELRVRDLDLVRPLHAVWRGRTPSELVTELVAIAVD